MKFSSAFPLHHNSREATGPNSNANQVHDKTELTKDANTIYKSHIDSSDLYSQEADYKKNPMGEEMQHKLSMESERLRSRLRQELAELQERLSPSLAHLNSTVANMRERLAPLAQQLHTSLSSNTKDLCGQLRLYLQGLQTAEAQAGASAALYQEAFQWMSQSLDHSSSKVADIIGDFHTGVMEHLKEASVGEEDAAKTDLLQEIRSRLGQEVSSLRVEAQNRVGSLKAELAALLETAHPLQAELTASIERLCQNTALQGQVFQARMERLFQGLEEEMGDQKTPSLSHSSTSVAIQPGDSLQGDFSVKLSALIQDIMHSVQ
uniref:Uncharacterized protein n=1 Tax=Anabas testudineus TaxID=64144 RepID=A0A3Q1IAH2_ANATE